MHGLHSSCVIPLTSATSILQHRTWQLRFFWPCSSPSHHPAVRPAEQVQTSVQIKLHSRGRAAVTQVAASSSSLRSWDSLFACGTASAFDSYRKSSSHWGTVCFTVRKPSCRKATETLAPTRARRDTKQDPSGPFGRLPALFRIKLQMHLCHKPSILRFNWVYSTILLAACWGTAAEKQILGCSGLVVSAACRCSSGSHRSWKLSFTTAATTTARTLNKLGNFF